MKTTDLFKINRSSKRINESMEKMFGQKINFESFDLPRLEDARNKLRTQLSQIRTESGFNENLENEAYTKAQFMLDAINSEIAERQEFIADPHVAEVSEAYVKGGIDWSAADTVTVKDRYDTEYTVADSPNGPLLLGEDIDGEWFADRDGGGVGGWIGFVVNIATGELVDFWSSSDNDWGDDEPDDYALEYPKEVAEEIKNAYGSTFEEIKAEAEGGMNVDTDEAFDDTAKPGDTFKTATGTATKTKTGTVHRRNFTANGKKDPEADYAPSRDAHVGAGIRLPDRETGRRPKLSDEPYESAPPGAKAERMVKHIKKGYAKDGKLTDKEKSIAYATAWKQHNKEKNESIESGEDMTQLREGEIQQASAIVTAKTMVDRVGRWIEELSGMENDTLLQLGDSIRDEMSAEQAKRFISQCAPAIQQALQNLKDTRETLSTGVRMLTGEEQGAEMLGGEPPMDGGFGSEPDAMNSGDLGGDEFGPPEDEFGAAEPAAGGLEAAGREQRESIDFGNKLLKVLAG